MSGKEQSTFYNNILVRDGEPSKAAYQVRNVEPFKAACQVRNG